MRFGQNFLPGIILMTTFLPVCGQDKNMIMWYIPLRIETYTAVTMDGIESSGAKKIIIKKQECVRELMDIIAQAKKLKTNKVNDGRIRVKVCYKENTYFIDAEGYIMNANRKFGKIDKDRFTKIIERYVH